MRPGGAFITRLSDDGVEFSPHLNACFLVVDDLERIVFTNALDSAWRPATPAPVPMTAEITFRDHPDGTDYRVVVRHGDPAARARHENLGFQAGWGAVRCGDSPARGLHQDRPRLTAGAADSGGSGARCRQKTGLVSAYSRQLLPKVFVQWTVFVPQRPSAVAVTGS